MDPIAASAAASAAKATDATAAEAAKVASNLLTRLLGPSADVIGQDWAERLRQRNLTRLLQKAQKRAELSGDAGYSAPRLAAATFEAAQYADDEVVTEYLSGVLASSRAPDGGDDSGLPWSAVIARLSTLQIRLHYVLYSNARGAIARQGEQFWQARNRTLLMPLEQVITAIGLDEDADSARFSDAIDGLIREGLLGDRFGVGSVEFLEEHDNEEWSFLAKSGRRRKLTAPFSGDVLVISISTHGIRLFLWGVGRGAADTDLYMNESEPLGLVDPNAVMAKIEGVATEAESWEEVDIDPNDSIEGASTENLDPSPPSDN